MLTLSRPLVLALLAGAMAAPAAAQEVEPRVGPGDVNEFRLGRDGRVAPPARPVPAPVQEQPEPVAEEPAPVPAPAASPPTSARVRKRAAPAPRTVPAQRPARGTGQPTTPAPSVASPNRTAPAEALPGALPAPMPPMSRLPAPPAKPEAEREAQPADTGGPSPWWFLPLLGGLVAAGWWWKGRKQELRPETAERTFDYREVSAMPAPEPLTAATPPADEGFVTTRMRPRIELEFLPAAASTTEAQAAVEYELVMVNSGSAPAHNLRMAARMLSSGPEQDVALAAFFAQPIARPEGAPPRTIGPGARASLKSRIALPAEEVRAVEVKGRQIFVPLVAFSVRYDSPGGEPGQTAVSYVVGREMDPPATKLAPLRLDLGPRVFRQLGQRVHEMKRAA